MDVKTKTLVDAYVDAGDFADCETEKAKKYLAELAEIDAKIMLGRSIYLLQGAIKKALEGSDKNGNPLIAPAISAIKELNDLLRLRDAATRKQEKDGQNLTIQTIMKYLASTGLVKIDEEPIKAARICCNWIVDRLSDSV